MASMTEQGASEKVHHRPIKILPPQLANQIAAGEVVERPASVVKELVENSLDAGATQVIIEIDQGGQKRILIRDNGYGIAKDELALALSRHATSKISNIDDLEHITSMGFRGEALASISSVSRLTLTSKPKNQSEAWQAHAEGMQMEVDIRPAAHPDGTSIEVVDLFFNTPARRKFLRTGKTEFQHIENIIKRLALTRPDVQFVLSHNQKVYLRYASVADSTKRIEQVCGKQMLPNCARVDYSFDGVTINGWCSQLGYGVATRDFQYTFVNGRMIKDKLLSHALRQVFEDTLPPQTFASYVLYLQVAPEQIDVNVHPAKHEVRFHQARQVHDIVFKALSDAISYPYPGPGEHSDDNKQAPSHNYIVPLSDASSSSVNRITAESGQPVYDAHTSIRQTGSVGNVARAQQTNAHLPSFASVTIDPTQNQHSAQHFVATPALGNDTGPVLLSGIREYLYSGPYLVRTSEDKLQVLPIERVLALFVTQRIARSTVSQPLLMPVSIDNAARVKQIQLDTLSDMHLLIVASHQKLILKQVPSELRHLPWASIFSQLPAEKLVLGEISNERVASIIAIAWLNTLTLTTDVITTYINEVDTQMLGRLWAAQGKTLDLQTWMKNA